MSNFTDVAVIGAGPYGLSLAANLRARHVSFRIFGDSMRFWRNMPIGLNLKSFAFATNISVPERGYSFPEWCRQNGLEDFEPCTMQSFAAYGLEIQKRFVPELEEVLATRIERAGRDFEITLATGDTFRSRRVVVCTGLSGLEHIPAALQGLGLARMQHTSSIANYSVFRGKRVAVIGGGASAIEAGALVQEAGGFAEVFVRGPKVIFHERTPRVRPLWARIKDPISVLGQSRKGWILEKLPLVAHFIPTHRRVRFFGGYLGPESPWWIKDRVLGRVPINLQQEVVDAEVTSNGVRLAMRISDNTLRNVEVDYAIAGTGYEFDVARVNFLGDTLKRDICRTDRAPILNLNFESSVPGLHFVGPLSSMSFGPLVRFVAGADFTVRRLARYLAQ
jgi:cation diffusion facilitator CzcD-associated flavoprotein CzcO